jgi:hypothetical protein
MGTFDFGNKLDDVERDVGPWFEATYPSESSCCGPDSIVPGDEIRADGDGGWEHRQCIEDDRV